MDLEKSINKLRIDEIERYIDGIHFIEYRPKSFTVNCGMGFNDSIKDMSCDMKIFDTGLEISHLIDDSYWDYGNAKFIDQELNDFLLKCRTIQTMNTCGGPVEEILVFLKNQIYVSIEALKPVTVNSFLVPQQKPQDEIKLVGIDILSQYSWCYGNFDDEDQLIIKEKKKNNSSFSI